MAKILKPTRFEEELITQIQKIADDEHSGNYTAALESLAKQALSMRSVDEDVRWKMYSGGKRFCDGFYDDKLTRKIIDGLHI